MSYVHWVMFDNRDRRIMAVGYCLRSQMVLQEAAYEGDEPFAVCRELRQPWQAYELYCDSQFRVRVIATDELAEQ